MVRLVLVLLLIRLNNWRESLKPMTKRSDRNHVVTFDGHLKTALLKQGFVVIRTVGASVYGHEIEGIYACAICETNVKYHYLVSA